MYNIHLLGAAFNFTNEGETSPFGTQYSGVFAEQHARIMLYRTQTSNFTFNALLHKETQQR